MRGKGHEFVLQKITDRKTRETGETKYYPRDFERVLRRHCKDR